MANEDRNSTHLTAGAKDAKGTIAKPAARTAAACMKPDRNLIPSGIASIVGVPMSKTMKKNQSVALVNVRQDECLTARDLRQCADNCKQKPGLVRREEINEASPWVIQ